MTALSGLRVLELTDERTAFAGRLLAQLGADVLAVEPPGGASLRHRPPFVDDEPGADRSLRWWALSAGKRSMVADVNDDAGRALVRSMVATADVVLEGEGHSLDRLGLGWDDFRTARDDLIWASVTPFGRESARRDDPTTDLTLLAGGGPVWNCGYDDHEIPPIRGGGDQALNLGGLNAAIGVLVALAHRDRTGAGQLVDVSINAACNVSSEQATYYWLVVQGTVFRQTGRHAMYFATSPVQVRCADGQYATTGVLPTKPDELGRLHAWLTDLGVLDQLPEAVFLQMAAERGTPLDLSRIGEDDEVTATMEAARGAVSLAAASLPAREFFYESQRRGFPAGAVFAPDEGFEEEHFAARGFHVEVEHPELGRRVRYPGAPYRFSGTPCATPPRPPLLDEPGAAWNEADR